jgi:plasmid stabilization system protein ParE
VAVVWSSEGADDFLAALTYLRKRNVAAAERLMREVNATLRQIDERGRDRATRSALEVTRMIDWARAENFEELRSVPKGIWTVGTKRRNSSESPESRSTLLREAAHPGVGS